MIDDWRWNSLDASAWRMSCGSGVVLGLEGSRLVW